MSVARIGVVADTHCPEFTDRLPDRVFEVLAGVDLILHAGDVNGQTTLEELARIAPVEAVQGDHDGDLIVHGHTHQPLIDTSGRPLVVNPGGVYQWTPATTAARLRQNPGWFEWSWLQVARHIRRYPSPTVGILEVTSTTIEPEIVAL